MKLIDIKAGVSAARAQALRDARRDYTNRCHFSRGTFLATADKNGQCKPAPAAECYNWNGTLRELNELIERVKRDFPDVTSVYLTGGYDGAESPVAYQNGDYDPWTGVWEFDVWRREGPCATSSPSATS